MKTFVTAFFGCFSEGIYCSLTKQQKQNVSANHSLVVTKHSNCHCTGKQMLI